MTVVAGVESDTDRDAWLCCVRRRILVAQTVNKHFGGATESPNGAKTFRGASRVLPLGSHHHDPLKCLPATHTRVSLFNFDGRGKHWAHSPNGIPKSSASVAHPALVRLGDIQSHQQHAYFPASKSHQRKEGRVGVPQATPRPQRRTGRADGATRSQTRDAEQRDASGSRGFE